jgi:hypothetical protein
MANRRLQGARLVETGQASLNRGQFEEIVPWAVTRGDLPRFESAQNGWAIAAHG